MKSEYKDGVTGNFFKTLDKKTSLCLLGLCLATNDIVLNVEQFGHHRDGENTYFFASSLSILRELAKVIMVIDKLDLKTRFSQSTCDLFESLKTELLPFHKNSLVKGTLKPVRDFTFHYDFSKYDEQKKIDSILECIRNEDKLALRVNIQEESIFRHRFTFADIFRNKLVNQYLSKDLVNKVSAIAVDTVAFVDSMLSDLCLEHNL